MQIVKSFKHALSYLALKIMLQKALKNKTPQRGVSKDLSMCKLRANVSFAFEKQKTSRTG